MCYARIAVAETFLPYFQRCTEPIHHRRVGVPERMETVTPWDVNSQLHEQRLELSLKQKISVPRRAILRSKEQQPLIRSPTLKEPRYVLARLTESSTIRMDVSVFGSPSLPRHALYRKNKIRRSKSRSSKMIPHNSPARSPVSAASP